MAHSAGSSDTTAPGLAPSRLRRGACRASAGGRRRCRPLAYPTCPRLVQKRPYLRARLFRFAGRIMAEQSTTPIPPDLAEAFAESYLCTTIGIPANWSMRSGLKRLSFSIISICGLVEQFTDQLPDHIFVILRAYMDGISDADLIVELAVNCSYANAARCLRRLIARRKAEDRLCEAQQR